METPSILLHALLDFMNGYTRLALGFAALLLVRNHLDQVVDTQDRNSSLGSGSQRFDLGDGWLQNTGLDIVAELAVQQIQSIPFESPVTLVGSRCLGSILVGPELGNEVSGVLGSIHRQGFGDHEERVGEFGNGELLAGALAC